MRNKENGTRRVTPVRIMGATKKKEDKPYGITGVVRSSKKSVRGVVARNKKKSGKKKPYGTATVVRRSKAKKHRYVIANRKRD